MLVRKTPMKRYHFDKPVNVRTQMILCCIPIAALIVFVRIEKFWYAMAISLPFTIYFDFIDKLTSNPDMDPLTIIAIIFPSLGVYVVVFVYFARKWSIVWNEKINRNSKPMD